MLTVLISTSFGRNSTGSLPNREQKNLAPGLTKILAFKDTPMKAALPALGGSPSNTIRSRFSKPLKPSSPMLLTLSGMVTLVRLRPPLKAFPPILVTGLPRKVEGISNSPE